MVRERSSLLTRWTLNAGIVAAVAAAFFMLMFVATSYLQHDVLRIRGLVVSFVLIGTALILRSEAHSYTPISKHQSR